MYCPLWSIFNQKETLCMGDKCGMFNLCRPPFRIDRCPNGHKNIEEVTASDSKNREFMCHECDERWEIEE